MHKKLQIIFYIFTGFLLVNCDDTKKDISTFFGGKIINPKSDHIILYTKEQAIDTFYLDNNQKFFGELKNIKEGLYYFVHGNENQYIYIEPKDSLLLRLNTWDFDESLVFAGIGADRNNILIDCFLENENDNRLFYQYYKLPPKDFKQKVDSLKAMKLTTLNQYIENHPKETQEYKNVLEVALTYPLYARIERYPLAYAKYTEKNEFPKLIDDFYTHREKVTFNHNELMYYPPYSYYVRNYLYNKTYSLGHAPSKKSYTAEFSTDLLNTINNEITSDRTKNAFLKQTIISHFYNKSSSDINKKPFERYLELSTNKEDKTQIQHLVNDTRAIDTGEKIQDFTVMSYSNAQHSIHDVIKNKNTLLFFWNPKNVSEWYIKSRMEYLENTYSNIHFVQVKMTGDLEQRIKNLDIKNQYYITSDSKAHEFLTSKMPRAVLINKDGKVTNGYASISSLNLNPYLQELNNY